MKVGIIGAGASGMMAAVTAAKEGADVTLFEKNTRVGKKILATGNGKCNLGNLNFSTDYYYCDDKAKLREIFDAFSAWDTVNTFEGMGMLFHIKNDYLYPYSEQASTVLDILRTELERTKVNLVTEAEIISAVHVDKENVFVLKDVKGNEYRFEKLIIACGSPASLKKGEGLGGYELAKEFGHKVKDMVPGLVQLKSDDTFIKALAGVRCQAGIKLMVDGKEMGQENGELQFTDYGVSGIPVFQVSRQAAYALKEGKKVSIVVDFYPEQDETVYFATNRLRYDALSDKTLENYLIGTLNKKINMVLLKLTGLKSNTVTGEVPYEKIRELLRLSRIFPIHINGVNSMENAQICAGGVAFSQLSAEMESEIVKGLYFAGEMVDVDGKCGGYNLQWAWTSGYVAGMNAAGISTIKRMEEAKIWGLGPVMDEEEG